MDETSQSLHTASRKILAMYNVLGRFNFDRLAGASTLRLRLDLTESRLI